MNLYKHQQDIIDADPKKCGLFLGTGSAKSRTALELAKGKILVVCPKTQRDDHMWERENKKWNINKDLTVLSKEDFKKNSLSLPAFNTIIIDESHCCTNVDPTVRWKKKVAIPKTSQIFDSLKRYIDMTVPDRLYCLTATPIRHPGTVLGHAWLLGKPWNFYEFRSTFYVPVKMNGREIWMPKKDSSTKDRLASAVQKLGYTGRLEDYFDVPDQVHKKEYVELTPKQKKRLKEIEIEYPDPLVQTGKRNQIENGILCGDEYNDVELFDNGKIDKIIDYAYEFPRMIVFAKYREQVAQINEALRQKGFNAVPITGDTKDRGEIFDEAKRSSQFILVVTAQISAGWEWKECPCVIYASRTYSYVDYAQSLGRVQRADAIKKNTYIYLISEGDTIDKEVDRCLETKQDFSERVFINKKQ